MVNNLCDIYDIPKRIYKCCSIKDKKVFVFFNLYFNNQKFSDEKLKEKDTVTWLLKKERKYGEIISFNEGKGTYKIKRKGKNGIINVKKNNIMKVHDFDIVLSLILENFKNKKDPFTNISKGLKENIEKELGDNFIDNIFPIKDYDYEFIFDEMIYEDDTIEIVLKKISKYCINFLEDYKYIYSSYINSLNEIKSFGFNYKNQKLMSIDDLIKKNICDIFKYNNIESFNIIDKYYQKNIENFDIKDQIIYFLNFNDFINIHDLDSFDFQSMTNMECGEVTSFKNNIIDKYWPLLLNEKITDIIGDSDKKNLEYQKQNDYLFEYSLGNNIINLNINNSSSCDSVYIDYLKKTKKQSKNLNVDLYKLFTEFKLDEIIPFVKWNSYNNERKFYKFYKDSIIYEGYREFEKPYDKIDFKKSQRWIKDFYRSKKLSLEKINRFESIQKEDMLSLKIFTEDKYCTLSIHIDGTLDFIIKKEEGDKNISSKDDLVNLFKISNYIIDKINDENKYSEIKLENFGENLDETFYQDIEFIDSIIIYKKSDYEVKNGIKNINQRKQGEELLPPFVIGEKAKLFIPILRKVCNNLNMFFRYMNEEDDENITDNVIGLQYKRSDDFKNINTIQSLISVYLNKGTYTEDSSIINNVSRIFNIEPEKVKNEIISIKEIEKDNYRKPLIVDEDSPNITISVRNNYIDFKIKNMKTFIEYLRIISLTKVIMYLFKEYINSGSNYEKSEIFLNNDQLKKIFTDNNLNINENIFFDEFQEFDEKDENKEIQNILDNMDSDSSTSSYKSSSASDMESVSGSSIEEVSGGGLQNGGTSVKSYYLKRLKENDKELFSPSKPWSVKQKNGDMYGYAKQCAENLDRKPISITKEELNRIDNWDSKESGKNSYSYSITVEGRSNDIHYICPQYWDISRDLPLTKDYVDKHKKDIIKNKANKENNTILERKGKYWDGIPDENSYKHFLPGFSKLILHPDKYKLPCCFSKRTLDKENKSFQQDGNQPYIPKDTVVPVKKYKTKKKLQKINLKETLPLSVGQVSHLPKNIKKMLSQDKIFEYDPTLSLSNGFIRKGVEQNNNDFIFEKSSFINSFIELSDLDYNDSNLFIEEEIIKPLRENIDLYQQCPTLHKYFKKNYLNSEDKDDIIKKYFHKTSKIVKKLKEMYSPKIINDITNNIKNDTLDKNNIIQSYIYSLVLSLKTYIDFLRSNEEKKDDYIIPALNVLMKEKVNIIIFEKEEEKITIKDTEIVSNENNKYFFIIKEDHYYEPIIYRINILKQQEDIKKLSKDVFNSFNIINKTSFKEFLKSPYPRGRNIDLLLGNSDECKKESKYCSEWVKLKDKKIKKGDDIRWIEKNIPGCHNSGIKNYSKYHSDDGINVKTIDGKYIKIDNIYLKINKKIVNPSLKKTIGTFDQDWKWIDKDCGDIYDKDIEALIRQNTKEGKIHDRHLLNMSLKDEEFNEEDITKGVTSNFFLINMILDDLDKSINKKEKLKDKYIFLNNKYLINSYSEITHIYQKNESDIKIIPIKPVKWTPYQEIYNKDIIFDLKEKDYPLFENIDKKEIKSIVINNNDQVTCVIVNNGIIPINKESIKNLNSYNVIKTNISPFDIDKLNFNVQGTLNYVHEYNNKMKLKEKLFTKLLTIIKDDTSLKHKIKTIIDVPDSNIKEKIKEIRDLLIKKDNSDIKFIEEFSYKLILSIENGDEISTISKLINTQVKYTDIEKNISSKEIFLKYTNDKELMLNTLHDIFIKKSSFLNIEDIDNYSDFNFIKTTKLKTLPYYIDKLFTPESTITFKLDSKNSDWLNLNYALQSLNIDTFLVADYFNEIDIENKYIPKERYKIPQKDIKKIIQNSLNTLGEDDIEIYKRKYNKYNYLRYGNEHIEFKNIKDIINYWRFDNNYQRINKPDIELILNSIKNTPIYRNKDFGILLISFTKGKEMDIEFFSSGIITLETEVVVLHHTYYRDDYVLSNLKINGETNFTVERLFQINKEKHEKWIKIDRDDSKILKDLEEKRDDLELLLRDNTKQKDIIKNQLSEINRKIQKKNK